MYIFNPRNHIMTTFPNSVTTKYLNHMENPKYARGNIVRQITVGRGD